MRENNFFPNIKAYISGHKHILWALYVPLYFLAFTIIEQNTTAKFHIIHIKYDDMIPFVKVFIIPYYMWFIYIAVTVVLFYIFDTDGFKKLALYLALGMTIFIVFSIIYPNMLQLRPANISGTGLINKMISALYKTDTPTNVFPSIHVYNSIVVFIAISKSKFGKQHNYIIILSFILTTLITLSTVFLKQHSLMDVFGALIMAGIFYIPVYLVKYNKKEISL